MDPFVDIRLSVTIYPFDDIRLSVTFYPFDDIRLSVTFYPFNDILLSVTFYPLYDIRLFVIRYLRTSKHFLLSLKMENICQACLLGIRSLFVCTPTFSRSIIFLSAYLFTVTKPKIFDAATFKQFFRFLWNERIDLFFSVK